jgi:hypothetical protein
VTYSDKPEVAKLSLNNLQGPIYLHSLVLGFAIVILLFEKIFGPKPHSASKAKVAW